jgi:F-type H+-transporting ATPase subunit b
MKVSGQVWRASVSALLLLLCAMMAHAAEEGAGHVMDTSGFKWVHFVIVAIATYWVFGRVLPPKFRSNAQNITGAIHKAAAAKVEAEKQLREATAKLASLEQEIALFRTQAEKDGAAELERIRAVTRLDAEKISAAAKAEIEAAEHAARVELKELAAKLAVDRAESLVAKELTPGLQEAMLTNFVQSLQERPN